VNAEQYAHLLQPLHKARVGLNPSGFSHVEAWDIRRTLIRIFGFGGFNIETVSCELVQQIESPPGTITYSNGTNDKTRWTVVYRAQVRLTIKDPLGRPIALFEDGACGDSSNQPKLGDAHDNAMKTALSQALKRCAVNLGDQFGLSLYNGGGGRPDEQGYHRAVVVRTLAAPPSSGGAPEPTGPVIDQAQDEPVQPEPGATAPVSAPPAPADTEAYSPPVGALPAEAPHAESHLPASEPWDDPAPAEPPAPEPAPTEPTPAPPAKSTPDRIYATGVAAVTSAKSLAQLDQLTALVADFETKGQLSPGHAGRLRLKIGAKRDELAATVPPPAGPPTDEPAGVIVGASS
jgi:hypothetical protein